MDKAGLVQVENDDAPYYDVPAMIAMLDYLVAEIGRIDPRAVQCLLMARESLSETVERPHARLN